MKERILLILLFLLLAPLSMRSQQESLAPVVIVSSYNPEVRSMRDNIQAFSEMYQHLECPHPLVLENMNCLNLSECQQWEARLWNILRKYYIHGRQPAAIVLLGGEAGMTYLSIKRPELKCTPLFLSMIGNDVVELPDSTVRDLHQWQPTCKYITHDFPDYNLAGGYVYEYNMGKNLDLLKHLYPDRDSLLFLSDNTLGGVTMQAHYRRQIKRHPQYHTQYLDGRQLDLMEVVDKLAKCNAQRKVLLIGTWRVDRSDSYTLRGTTYALSHANASLPAFTLASVGMGHWAIAGYIPQYQNKGAALAEEVVQYLRHGVKQPVTLIPSSYRFDYVKLNEHGINLQRFPHAYELINTPVSFWKRNGEVLTAALVIITLLLLALVILLKALQRVQHMKGQLEKKGNELEQALERAEEGNLMKSRFISSMSHEIRTPLNAIVGFSQLLSDPPADMTADEEADIAHRLTLNSDLLLKLINDILELSRMDEGRAKLIFKEVDFGQLTRLATRANQVNLPPEVEMRCEIPEEPIVMQTDATRIMQVYSNLLSNAKKFTTRGHITVTLSYKPGDRYLNVRVSDTGCGIPADKAETVFKRFEKLDEFQQGTGLGLSITRTIIEQLGGRIWLDTRYTAGACFVFVLPLNPEQEKAQQTRA